jgi:hypothetical protein
MPPRCFVEGLDGWLSEETRGEWRDKIQGFFLFDTDALIYPAGDAPQGPL